MSVSLSIKGVPDHVVRDLRARAKRHHRSLQGELMNILEEAVRQPKPFHAVRLLKEIRALGLATPDESVQMIREDRDR